MSTAEELKQLGNKAFSAGDHEAAIKHFTAAIALDPSNHVLYSNRSASFCSVKCYGQALEDAEKCISIKPDWSKGYSRKGAALFGLKKYPDAEKAYSAGLAIDPTNEQLKKGVSDAKEATVGTSMNALTQIFSDPNFLPKLSANPKTKPYVSQPDFLEKVKQIQENPRALEMHLSDPRILQIFTVLLGDKAGGIFEEELQEQGFQPAGEEPKKEEPKKEEPKKEEPKKEEPKKEEPKKEEPKKEEPKREEPKKEVPKKEEPKEEVPMDTDESTEVKENKKRASEEKELGTQLYKKREFQGALEHYNKAWDLDKSNIVYLNNIAAVYFEMGEMDKCIETCLKAVDHGREIRANYETISKALARIGNAYMKKEDYANAATYFGKAQAEHRTPEIQTKLREAEKLRDQKAKEAYINPQLSDEAREKGNALFKEQKYAEALKSYEEAIKRNPKDAKNFSNRAAAYSKLMALPEALKDSEEAIRLDPNFIKAHIRKGNTLLSMKKYGEALRALEEAKKVDTQNAHAAEIRDLEMKCIGASRNLSEEEVAENARKNPEVLEILNDPVMRSILDQMETNPSAIKEHMKNPMVAKKIQKLIDAGIIR